MNKKPRYNKKLKPLARKLRNDSTLGEVLLWSNVLRAKKMLGYQFNRQFSLKIPKEENEQKDLNIIVDFICRKLKLVIEIDGYSHNFKQEKDRIRDYKLSKYGYTVLRFTENEVRNDINNVIRVIELKINELEKDINPLTPFTKGD